MNNIEPLIRELQNSMNIYIGSIEKRVEDSRKDNEKIEKQIHDVELVVHEMKNNCTRHMGEMKALVKEEVAVASKDIKESMKDKISKTNFRLTLGIVVAILAILKYLHIL